MVLPRSGACLHKLLYLEYRSGVHEMERVTRRKIFMAGDGARAKSLEIIEQVYNLEYNLEPSMHIIFDFTRNPW